MIESIQPLIEAGAITVVSIAVAFAAFAIYKMSGMIPSLTAAMGTMAKNTSDAIADGKEERTTYQETSRSFVSEMKNLISELATFSSEMKTGQALQSTEIATLTKEVSGLKNVMTDQSPNMKDVLKAIQELQKDVTELKTYGREVIDTFETKYMDRVSDIEGRVGMVETTIKRVTSEHSTVEPPTTAAQDAVQLIKGELKGKG